MRGKKLLALSLVALGVVYGDIGTSPLYAIRECFHGEYGIEPSASNVLGVLSLVFWSLVLVVTVKYLGFVMRADNDGEGGVLALMALAARTGGKRRSVRLGAVVAFGLFGAALLYGDGMITPAISVLSAIEGLEIATPALEPYVIPLTIAILAGLFLIQHRGTAGVGVIFGPVTLLWLLVLAALGVGGIAREPSVLRALGPWHAVEFFGRHGLGSIFVLGAVFLVVTGAEALYADMGHFGKRPIRFAWLVLVLPALLLNYFGQGALLLVDPERAHNPFYSLAPSWALYPLVALATAATIIASQAVISGAFSLTRQAIQMGYLPRMRIVHTSKSEIGQIYIPEINWLLMASTIILVVAFGSSSKLAAAYGVAVTTTMVITSLLFFVLAVKQWKWPLWAAVGLVALFLAVDLAFFSANIIKISHGAWFPLAVGAVAYVMMSTWRRGRQYLSKRIRNMTAPLEQFLEKAKEQKVKRVEGTAVFLTSNPKVAPPALVLNTEHNKVLHENIVLLTVETADVPRVDSRKRVEVEKLAEGVYFILARYGFMEDPNVPRVLRMAARRGLDVDLGRVSYFLGRERLIKRPGGLNRVQEVIFDFLSRNALGATAYFHVPPNRVIEVGAQIEI